jgi:hypothetical protein
VVLVAALNLADEALTLLAVLYPRYVHEQNPLLAPLIRRMGASVVLGGKSLETLVVCGLLVLIYSMWPRMAWVLLALCLVLATGVVVADIVSLLPLLPLVHLP